MTFAGAPDFQGQNAETTTPMGALAVNTAGPQTFDITSSVQPHLQGILLFWSAAFGSAGEAVVVTVEQTTNATVFRGPSLVRDGGFLMVPFEGRLITDVIGNALQVIADVPTGGASPLVGTLTVVGLTHTPLVLPGAPAQLVGFTTVTGNVTVLAGATTTILAAPQAGTYYRVKLLSYITSVTPAGGLALQWSTLNGGVTFANFTSVATLRDSGVLACDFILNDGVTFRNATAVTYQGTIIAEQWPI